MSSRYEMVEHWWTAMHNIMMIKNAVKKGFITAEEFAEITGEAYQDGAS